MTSREELEQVIMAGCMDRISEAIDAYRDSLIGAIADDMETAATFAEQITDPGAERDMTVQVYRGMAETLREAWELK